MKDNTYFAFDLDGTVSMEELLPLISKELNLEEELNLLTRLTLDGTISFNSSFKLRFQILKSIPVEVVQKISSKVLLNNYIEAFINRHKSRCAIVTGNLDVWVEPFISRLGCSMFSSISYLKNEKLELRKICNKGDVVRGLQKQGYNVVAIGDSFNDLPMFDEANICIAYGGVHEPIEQLVHCSDFVVYDGESLCRLLTTL